MNYQYQVRFVDDDEVHTVGPDESLSDVIMEMMTQHSPPQPVMVEAVALAE